MSKNLEVRPSSLALSATSARTSRSGLRGAKGFTLIELTVALVIVVILARAGSFLLTNLVQDGVFIPGQLNTDMISMDILQMIVEGDASAQGLRNSRSMTSIAANDLTFVNQDSVTIRYRLDTGTNRFYRTIGAGAETLFPYYLPSGVNVIAKGGSLFTYYDSTETVTATAANVRWITIGLIVRVGGGSFNNWEGQSDKMTSVSVPKMQ